MFLAQMERANKFSRFPYFEKTRYAFSQKIKICEELISDTRFSADLLEDRKAKSVFEIEMTPLRISSSLIRENIAKG